MANLQFNFSPDNKKGQFDWPFFSRLCQQKGKIDKKEAEKGHGSKWIKSESKNVLATYRLLCMSL
jgi:hypothetical protein